MPPNREYPTFDMLQQTALRMKQQLISFSNQQRGKPVGSETDNDIALRCAIIDDLASMLGMAFDMHDQEVALENGARRETKQTIAQYEGLKEFEAGRAAGKLTTEASNLILKEWERRKRPGPNEPSFSAWVAGVWAGSTKALQSAPTNKGG